MYMYIFWFFLFALTDDPDTVQTKHDMAALRSNQQKYDLAVQLFDEVYETRRRVLGKDHPVCAQVGPYVKLHFVLCICSRDGNGSPKSKIQYTFPVASQFLYFAISAQYF
jgi:hypothetical protein